MDAPKITLEQRVAELEAQLAEQATLLNPNAGHPPVPASQHPPTADLMAMAEKVAKRHLLTEQEIIDGGVALVMGDDAIPPNAEGPSKTLEDEAREMLRRMGVPEPESYSSGDLVELANLIGSKSANAEGPTAEEVEHEVHRLRQFALAYPEDIFTPLSDDDRAKYGASGVIDRASAQMGRHLAINFTKAADLIERLSAQVADFERADEDAAYERRTRNDT